MRADLKLAGMLPHMTACSRCGRQTFGVELTPGAVSSVCRPGEGCSAKPIQVKEEVKAKIRAGTKK